MARTRREGMGKREKGEERPQRCERCKRIWISDRVDENGNSYRGGTILGSDWWGKVFTRLNVEISLEA
jgi:hypothetical protein